MQQVPATGKVITEVTTDNATWYVSAELPGEGTTILYAGIYEPLKGIHVEIKLGETEGFIQADRIQLCGRAMFFLVKNEAGTDLYRVSCNSEKVDIYQGIVDYQLLHGTPVILEKDSEKNYLLVYRGKEVPLYMDGTPRFDKLVDERLLYIADGSMVEIIDTVTWKYVYRYTKTATPVQPEDYNCMLELRDINTGRGSIEERIFYKVFIDGNEEGRTIAASRATPLTYNLAIEPSSTHSIIIERWELDRTSGRYRRANNIRQPGVIWLYAPADRVVKVSVDFDGRGYTVHRDILMQP